MTKLPKYEELKPRAQLEHLVNSFWIHRNLSDEPESMTIFPDSFFKMVIFFKGDTISKYFMTGLWTSQKEIVIPPKSQTLGCRFQLLAPEYLFNREIASLLDEIRQLDLTYCNVERFNLSNFEESVKQWERELIAMKPTTQIQGHKLRLSQLLYQAKGDITASEVSNQIFWANRQINRYMNKYLGVSLKKYLNIQKCYQSYLHIREGELKPEDFYYDQAHFIKEIKKHTGETPGSLYQSQNDRFIQLRNIQSE